MSAGSSEVVLPGATVVAARVATTDDRKSRITPALSLAWVNPSALDTPLPWLQFWRDPGRYRIKGTKRQLQSLGIGVGVAFPGEKGGLKGRAVHNRLHTTDANGHPATVWAVECVGAEVATYVASLPTPGLPPEPNVSESADDFAPGVTIERGISYDAHCGTAEALCAAGIVPQGHFPGMPGMRKVTVTIYADGSVPDSASAANSSRAREPGARSISQVRRGVFRVCIHITNDERQRRQAAYDIKMAAWHAMAENHPRPDPPTRVPGRLLRLV